MRRASAAVEALKTTFLWIYWGLSHERPSSSVFPQAKVMARRNHDTSYHESRDKDYSHRGERDARDRNQAPRDVDKRGPAGDSRAKQTRGRDATTASDMGTPAPRDRYREGPSRM